MQALYQFDCLRANKSTMAWGVEARVPFLDRWAWGGEGRCPRGRQGGYHLYLVGQEGADHCCMRAVVGRQAAFDAALLPVWCSRPSAPTSSHCPCCYVPLSLSVLAAGRAFLDLAMAIDPAEKMIDKAAGA